MHQFLPLRKFLDEIFLCRLLLLYFSARFSSSYTELLSIRVCWFLLVPFEAKPFEYKQFHPLQTQQFLRTQPNCGNIVIG